MPGTRPPYSPEFRRQKVELVRAGRSPEVLFSPTLADRLDCHRDALVAVMDRRIYGMHTTANPYTSYLNRDDALHGTGDDEGVVQTADLCRKHGVSSAMFRQ